MSVVIPDTSPSELLGRLRGQRISDARPGYPEVIHLHVPDPGGAKWVFSTWDADYSPSDPAALRGKTIVSADLVGPLGNLTISFSDGTDFRVTMEPQTAENDPMNWTLLTPDGFILVWGPGANWALKRGDEPL